MRLTAPAGLRFFITASEEYSDNFRLSDDTPATDNFRSMLSPGAQLDINSAFTKGSLAYTLAAAHDSSAANDDDISLFHSFAGLVAWEASPRLKFTVGDTFIHSDEPSQADRLSLRRERRTYTSNEFSLTSDYVLDRLAVTAYYQLATFWDEEDTTSHTVGLTAKTIFYDTNAVTVGYEYLSSETRGQRDFESFARSGPSSITGHRVFGALQRQLTHFTSAGIAGSYAFRNADTRSEDYDFWDVSLFTAYGGPRLSFVTTIGYSQYLRESEGPESSISTTSSLTYRFARAVVSVSVDSGFSETFTEGENFGVVKTRGVTASLSYPFTPLFSGAISGFYRQNKTVGDAGSSGRLDETTWGGLLTVAIQLTRWLGLVVEYAYTDASSSGAATDPLRDYTENRARIALTASF